MAHWRLFYHFVWTTKNRAPLLTPTIETNIYRFLASEAKKMHTPLFVINGTMDHVHVLTAVRPSISPSNFVKQLKGSSSRFVTVKFDCHFEWQKGFGVFSVSEENVPRIMQYVKRQKQHHAQNTQVDEWEHVHEWNIGPQPSA